MKLLWFLSQFVGATSAILGLSFEPKKWLGLGMAVFDDSKREALKLWNFAYFAALRGKKALENAMKYSPLDGVSKKDVKFYLYTKLNPTEPVEINEDPEVLSRTYFNANAPVKIICHGYRGNYERGPGKTIPPAYLQYMGNVNVIVIDWSNSAGPIKMSVSWKDLLNILYFLPAKYTESVGRLTAEMIDFLISQGASLENFHLIGHSLGAHAMGWAGRSVKAGKVSRITGLDAASLCFETNSLSACIFKYTPLSSGDAEFVDVIHTSGFTGFKSHIGHVDFYPNGGLTQPGCKEGDFMFGVSSHFRSNILFAESINPANCLIGRKCSSWQDYKEAKCGSSRELAKMGEFCDRTARGKYFLETTDKPPFTMCQNNVLKMNDF